MNVNIHITIYDTGINRARFYTSCYAALLVMSCGLGLGWHCPDNITKYTVVRVAVESLQEKRENAAEDDGCPDDKYFDARRGRWIPCSVVCPPRRTKDTSIDFCHRQCQGLFTIYFYHPRQC